MPSEIILASNVTEATCQSMTDLFIVGPHSLVGFHANPNYRGTVNIVESCLFTILACSWSILHMNLPAPKDGWWRKQFRKAKWTLLTIFCPEFLLAHALVERQMAFMNMATMKKLKESKKLDGWRIENAETFLQVIERRMRKGFVSKHVSKKHEEVAMSQRKFLGESTAPTIDQTVSCRHRTQDRANAVDFKHDHAVGIPEIQDDDEGEICSQNNGGTNFDSKYISVDDALVPDRTWTLTHAYYANMGGIRMVMLPSGLPPESDMPSDNVSTYVTADMLADLLAKDGTEEKNSFNPLRWLRISESDIDDKSNADAFTKLIALMQILWLVFSVIARKLRGIASSQLEIMTLAFEMLAVVTYLAYFNKPQNVGEATTLRVEIDCVNDADLPKILNRQLDCRRPHSFFKFVFSPFVVRDESTIKYDPQNRHRVPNDNIQFKTEFNTESLDQISGWIALATMGFGLLHCIAWNFTFPSKIERLIWRVASLVTAFAPAVVLGVNSPLVYYAGRKYRDIMDTPEKWRDYDQLLISYKWATRFLTWLSRIFTIFGIVIYVISRIATSAIAITSLRSMPADVYYTTWAKYFPNVQ